MSETKKDDKPSIHVDETWVIAIASGKTYVGARQVSPQPSDTGQDEAEEEDEALVLCPCYEVRETQQAVKQPGGVVGIAIQQQAMPLAFLAYPVPWTIYPDAMCDVGDMHESDRRFVVGWVKAAEAGRTRMQAERANLILPH